MNELLNTRLGRARLRVWVATAITVLLLAIATVVGGAALAAPDGTPGPAPKALDKASPKAGLIVTPDNDGLGRKFH